MRQIGSVDECDARAVVIADRGGRWRRQGGILDQA